MKELFLQTVEVLSKAASEEKEAASLMYVTAFIRMLREGGYLYRRELEKDGLSTIILIVDGKEFRCKEQVIEYYTGNTLPLSPYEDRSEHFKDIFLLEQKNILQEKAEEKEIKEKKTIELPRIEIAEKTPFEELPEAPELTLTEEQQADYLEDSTEYYKIGVSLNYVGALACMVFAAVVLFLC